MSDLSMFRVSLALGDLEGTDPEDAASIFPHGIIAMLIRTQLEQAGIVKDES